MLPEYESSRLARNIVQEQYNIDEAIRIEQEILQAKESQPSLYSAGVSLRARDAWQERAWLNKERVKQYKLRDQVLLTSNRPGRSFHMYEFLRLLNTLPRRHFTLNGWSLRGMRGLSVSRGGSPSKYVCAIDNGVIPEWSRIELDDKDLIKRQSSRGWRAVLLMLLDQQLISEQEMLDRFGLAQGKSGQLHRKYLWESRNHKLGVSEENIERGRLRESEITW